MDFATYSKCISDMSGEKFLANSLEICKQIQDRYQVLAFAFIIFDEQNPQIRKVLRDNDYYEALSAASGDRLLVFTIADGRKTDSMKMLVEIDGTKKEIRQSYSEVLTSVFGNPIDIKYPAVLFFQFVADNTTKGCLVDLGQESVEESARNLQNLLKSISKVLDGVSEEYFGNKKEILDLVNAEVERQNLVATIINIGRSFDQVFKMVKKCLGLIPNGS